MKEKFIPATYESDAFHCPFCGVYSHHYWYGSGKLALIGLEDIIENMRFSTCEHCKNNVVWVNEKIVHPISTIAPLPEDDMPVDSKADYIEASSIVSLSPRAACALLRLSLQKLMFSLGEKGDLNVAIGNLVKKGLPEGVQKALDCVRVIGNNAVHPAELDLKDDVATAISLFDLLNIIVNYMITKPIEIKSLYEKLPQGAKDAIFKRDN